jgi:hypothetical protein
MNFNRRICFAPEDLGGGNPPAGDPPPNAKTPPPGDPPPAPEWLNSLPDDLKADDRLKSIPDVGTLAGRFAKAIELPGDDAKPEERDAALDALANKLGRPEKAEGYQIPEVKDRPYTDRDKALQQEFLPVAHAARMTQAQVEAVVKFNNDLVEKIVAVQTKSAAETEAALRQKLGDNFDGALELGNRAVARVLEEAGIKVDDFRLIQLCNGSFWGDSPMANALFIGIGKLIGETKFVQGDGNAGGANGVDAKKLYPNSQHN